MIKSKNTAALLRFKEIDRKYKARYEDQKQEQSSDNTESLLEQVKYTKNILPSLLTEKKEIFKAALNIKIPDFRSTEQLESCSTTSGKDSASLRVSIVTETPVATPRVASQSVSGIQEELDDAESIAKVLESFDRSNSEVAKSSHERLGSSYASAALIAKSISTEKKELKNYETVLKDGRSNDYSNDSFDSYFSVVENSSSTDSQKKDSKPKIVSPKSNIREENGIIAASNTEKNDGVLSESEGISDIDFSESIGKENEIATLRDTGTTDEGDEIAEESSMSVEATDLLCSKLDANIPKESRRAESGQKRSNRRVSENANKEKWKISLSSLEDRNSSSAKSGRYRSEPDDLAIVDETENDDGLCRSAKVLINSLLEKFNNNKTTLFISPHTTNLTSLESLRRKKHRRKFSKSVGSVSEANAIESKSSSRQLSSGGSRQNCDAAMGRRAVKTGLSKIVDRKVPTSLSAIETGATKERKNSTIMRGKNHCQDSKVFERIKSDEKGGKASKSWTSNRVNEEEYLERNYRELECLEMRMRYLRLEQERLSMLRYTRDFEKDRERLLLWPNRFYCPGTPGVSVIEPLNFPNVLNFSKSDSTPAERGLISSDNHLAPLKDRVAEIREWLKNQFILYRDYSDVAAAINAQYIAETEVEKVVRSAAARSRRETPEVAVESSL